MFKSKLMLRSQLLIDPNVQWPVLQRTALYTGACAVYFMVVLFFSESSKIGFESPWKSLRHSADVIACWAPGLTMLIPIIVYDLLIFTNRFAGPMYRIRREMQLLIKDESVSAVKLRDNDHWIEIADLFNEIRAELIELREARSPMAKSLFGAMSAESGSLDSIEPEAVESKAVESKAVEPKAVEPKAVEPKAVEPKAVEPKAEEPKAVEPKAEEPKAEEPKAEEPKAVEPKAVEPKTGIGEKAAELSTEIDEKPPVDQPPPSNSASEFSAEDFEMPTTSKPQKSQDDQTPTEDSPIEPAETPTVAAEEVLGEPVKNEEVEPATAETPATATA